MLRGGCHYKWLLRGHHLWHRQLLIEDYVSDNDPTSVKMSRTIVLGVNNRPNKKTMRWRFM